VFLIIFSPPKTEILKFLLHYKSADHKGSILQYPIKLLTFYFSIFIQTFFIKCLYICCILYFKAMPTFMVFNKVRKKYL
uniref:Uncharacterized protein n=1 Tax=Cyanoderma ruficeps TaxID=181631 RepID=A0A8C3P221_9PASS